MEAADGPAQGVPGLIMSEKEQIQAFADDLDRLVQRYIDEFELTAASAVGCLAFKMHTIMACAQKDYEENGED